MKLKEILNMSIETKIIESIKKNLTDLKLFFVAFVINILIYGQKIFFYSIATDDYARYYSHGDGMSLARVSGRWAQDLLNNYVFVGKLHVLPYFHGVIGVLAFSLVGFLAAKYLKRTNSLEILIITLLISASPMFAHNLYFNTNITVWLTTVLGVIGFLMIYKSNVFIKMIGFVFLVISIGTYQTIMQVILAMIVFKSMLELLEIENTKKMKNVFLNALWLVLLVALAYAVSAGINEYIIHHYNLIEGGRYKIAGYIPGISMYVGRIIRMYQSTVHLNYFSIQLLTMYNIMAALSILSILFTILRRKIDNDSKIISFTLITLLFLSIPIIIYLPIITGNIIPTRAHYTIGWVLAGLFAIQMFSFKGIFKTLSTFLAISIIIVNIYYIDIFFDAASRQTSADITRVNQIVNRIRTNKNYITEPMKFKIIGKKSFPVIGWKSDQQALNTNWSKYQVFQNFSDFKYTKMKDDEYNEVKEFLIKKGETINSYPGKNSIVVYKDKAILFLNSNKINAEIKF